MAADECVEGKALRERQKETQLQYAHAMNRGKVRHTLLSQANVEELQTRARKRYKVARKLVRDHEVGCEICSARISQTHGASIG